MNIFYDDMNIILQKCPGNQNKSRHLEVPLSGLFLILHGEISLEKDLQKTTEEIQM